MSDLSSTSPSHPPRLSMDAYADFVEASLRECDPVMATRQKELEERIRTPFRMPVAGSAATLDKASAPV